MSTHAYMTTSWDDGHPADSRLAQMLAQNGLAGTFYIPRKAQALMICEPEIRALSDRFEIGAHTMHHTFLDTATDLVAQREILESKGWVEDVTGKSCKMFCPPAGKFGPRDMRFMRQAGYLGMRSVELMSTAAPRTSDGLYVMPTTMHAYPHRPMTYLKNAAKRGAPQNLWRYITHRKKTADWEQLAISLLEEVATRGGVFHLWGHSWEIDDAGQWAQLDAVFRAMNRYTDRLACLTNSQVCEAVRDAVPAFSAVHEIA